MFFSGCKSAARHICSPSLSRMRTRQKRDPFSLRARHAGASWKPQGLCFMFAKQTLHAPTARFILQPPPLGEVARLAVTEGVRLIHPTDCKDNRRIFRGGRCRKDRQSDRAVALTALPLLLRFCGSRISPFPVKTARFGQNPFPFSPFCRHAGFFFLLFPAPFLPAFCILPSLVSCFCAGFFPCGSAVLLFYIFV